MGYYTGFLALMKQTLIIMLSIFGFKIGANGKPVCASQQGQLQYNVSIQDTQIPVGAFGLMLSAINSENDEIALGIYNLANNIADEPVSTLPTDYQPSVGFIDQIDFDGDQGEIGASYTFMLMIAPVL